jgi:ABC-type glycerol-3-phosphate transport system substrate-binding protein
VPGIEVGVGALPGVPGGSGEPLRFGGFLWIFELRPEREQESAWKFIKWLMEPEQQAEWFAGTGYLPVSRSAVDQPVAKDVVAQYPLFQWRRKYLNRRRRRRLPWPGSPSTRSAKPRPGWGDAIRQRGLTNPAKRRRRRQRRHRRVQPE